jgi:hypothetical protein
MANKDVRRLEEVNDLTFWDAPVPENMALAAADETVNDKAVAHLYGTDMSSLPPTGSDLSAAGYNDWPDVVSTIWNKTLNLSGYNPASEDYSSSTFQAFKQKFATCPFWNGIYFEIRHREATVRVRDYHDIVGSIIDLVTFVASGDLRQAVIGSVKQIAEKLARTGNQNIKDSLGQNGSILVDNGKIYSACIFGTIELSQTEGKWSVTREQKLNIYRGYGVLNFGFCQRHADRIASYEKKIIDDWDNMGNADSSAQNPSPGW